MSSANVVVKVKPIINIHGYLECPVCLAFAVTPIYSCKNGHVVCGICKDRVKICPNPTCNAGNIQEMWLINRILEVERIPCRNYDQGCTKKVQPSKMKEHLASSCDFRPIKCFRLACDDKSYAPKEMYKHWGEIHAIEKINQGTSTHSNAMNLVTTFRLPWSIPNETFKSAMDSPESKIRILPWAPMYFEIGNLTFFFHQRGTEETVHAWITFLGEESDAKKYEYTAIISSKLCKSEKKQVTFTEIPIHSMQYNDFEKVSAVGDTAVISYNNLKRLQDSSPTDPLNLFEWEIQIDIFKV